MSRLTTKPESFMTNTDRDERNTSTILTEVLEQRTGSQGWFSVREDAYDLQGRRIDYYKALYGNNSRARQVWWSISRTPELEALYTAVSPNFNEPQFNGCDFDDQTKRALTALHWTKKAEQRERWDRSRAQEARAKARQLLNGITEQKCSCGHTHEHSEKPSVPLPTPADVRKLVEQAVDKHLVNNLLR